MASTARPLLSLTATPLAALPRSSFYYQPVAADPLTLELMDAIARIYTEHPIYGVRRMARP